MAEAWGQAEAARSGFLDTANRIVVAEFFLTSDELEEAAVLRRSFWRQPLNRLMGRIICAVGVWFFATLPGRIGGGWLELLRAQPALAFLWAVMVVVDFYVAIDQPGERKLDALLNRLNALRQITVEEKGVLVRHGSREYCYNWRQLGGFSENSNLYVLQVLGSTTFWTLPKRAIPYAGEAVVSSLLNQNLPRK